ncbi:MAG: hypothetical protein U5Q03_14980 [Bacteroidota bacterium]|nr:hypothetical protein [Bacteroidota bacterium]
MMQVLAILAGLAIWGLLIGLVAACIASRKELRELSDHPVRLFFAMVLRRV